MKKLLAFLTALRNSQSSAATSPHMETRKDIALMMAELKKLYDEKASLSAENKRLKQEIAALKKKS